MEYSFDVKIAEKYGLKEAVMLKNIVFWCMKNRANNINYYDGLYWTYNSNKALSVLFPFWTEKQIRSILGSLEEKELIVSGNYNKSSYDRTKWYASTNKAYTEMGEYILPDEKIHLPNRANETDQKGEPIPYINTDNKQRYKDIHCREENYDEKEVIDYLNKKSHSKFNYNTAETKKLLSGRFSDGYTAEDMQHVIDLKCEQWLTDVKMRQYIRPSTLFLPSKFESYLNEYNRTHTDEQQECKSEVKNNTNSPHIAIPEDCR